MGSYCVRPSAPTLSASEPLGSGGGREPGDEATVRAFDIPRAVQSAVATASAVGLTVDDATVVHDPDRDLLSTTLQRLTASITNRGADEQLLHGEPHPGNLLNTKAGPLFVDLGTCCRGPVEFDIAHAPEEVSEHYPAVDEDLLRECR